MTTVCVTGGMGFIGRTICNLLLDSGYKVICVDNLEKYNKVVVDLMKRDGFRFVCRDLRDNGLPDLDYEYIIHCAAKIGGIRYFHSIPYDIISENGRIDANVIDSAISRWKKGQLKKIVVMSSSMVYESATKWPILESDLDVIPMPKSTYGFSKLKTELLVRGAYEQHGLPYSIAVPFNAIGVGEDDFRSGNSHAVPDLVWKLLCNSKSLAILGDGSQIRCYTNVKDVAKGVIYCMINDRATGERFNISNARATTVMELVKIIETQLGIDEVKYEFTPSLKYDVRTRIPDVSKAKEYLGFEAKISLEDSVAEVIQEMKCYQS